MRLALAPLLVCACQSAAHKQVLTDISQKLDRRDNGQAVAAYERFRDGHGEDEDALRALAVGVLHQALASPDPAARRAAVLSAERHEVEALFDDVSALLGDEDDLVRATAAAAVLRSHPDAGRVLAGELASGPPEARAIAVSALGRKIPDLAADDIRAALVDPDGRVRAAAISALGANAPASALSDPYLGARLAALSARGKDAARELVTSPDSYLRLRAAAMLGDPSALPIGLAAADPAVREAALNEAASIDPASAAKVEPLLEDPEPRVRLAAARALGRLGRADRAREFLAAALSSEDPSLRLDAADALVALGDPRGEPALASFGSAESPALRRAAVASYPTRRPVPPPVLSALADVDFGVRVAAADFILRAL